MKRLDEAIGSPSAGSAVVALSAWDRPSAEPVRGWWAWVLFASVAVILSACQSGAPKGAGAAVWKDAPKAAAADQSHLEVPTVAASPAAAGAGLPLFRTSEPAKPAADSMIRPVAYQEVGPPTTAPRPQAAPAQQAYGPPPPSYGPPAGYAPQPGYGPPPPGYAPQGPYGTPAMPAAYMASNMGRGRRGGFGHGGPAGCADGCCAPKGPLGPGDGEDSGPPPGFPPTDCFTPEGNYCPPDEYIYDGGDRWQKAAVIEGDTVVGLQQEDTIVHYDTLDGRTKVDESNRVCIYAPRFAAVRNVASVGLNEQTLGSYGARQPLGPELALERQPVVARVQSLQLGRNIALNQMDQLRVRQMGVLAEQLVRPFDYTMDLLPYENLEFIRYGVLVNAERPRLAQTAQAATVWTHDQAVQVILDDEKALELKFDQAAQEVFKVYARGPSKLRLCKIASTHAAQPGEIIEFTLRFDNVGDRPVGNVVIVDNLTTRLEYVPGSAQASCKADYERDADGVIKRNEKKQPIWRQNPIGFSHQWNEGETLVLRWALGEPLKPGQGGIIKFQCRVR